MLYICLSPSFPVLAINSLENFLLISCTRDKFSREISISTAITSLICVSLVSVLPVSKKTAIHLYIAVVSV